MVPNGGRLHDHCCCCNKPGRSKELVYSRYGSEAAMFHTIDNEDEDFHDHDDADHDDHHHIYCILLSSLAGGPDMVAKSETSLQ